MAEKPREVSVSERIKRLLAERKIQQPSADPVQRYARVLAELKKQQPNADPIQRFTRTLQPDRESYQKHLARLKKSATPSVTSLSALASTQSKDVEKQKELLDRIDKLSKELSKTKQEKSEKERVASQLQEALAEYQKQSDIKYLLGKIDKDAEGLIRTNDGFLSEFAPGKSHDSFIISIDIRASTELMLNAKSPQAFARFITGLCDRLTEIVIDNGGILDKFTGDGVLAFFPTFYSGDDAGYRVIVAATEAIEFFREHYKANRECFRVVIANTGLGVGIDWGTVHFVNIAESLSVVGTPVVYACRLSSAPAGTICANQPAKEIFNQKYPSHTIVEECIIEIKESGPVIAYTVKLKGDHLSPSEPQWKKMPTTASTVAMPRDGEPSG